MIAGDPEDEGKIAADEESITVSNEKISAEEKKSWISSNGANLEEKEDKDLAMASRKRKPGNLATKTPVDETVGVISEESVSKTDLPMSEAKEKVQAQVNDVLERQMAGETTPLRQKEVENVVEENGTTNLLVANGSRSSIGESPLKNHVIETEEMARATTTPGEKIPEPKSSEEKSSAAFIASASKTSLKSAAETSTKSATNVSTKSATNVSTKSATNVSTKSNLSGGKGSSTSVSNNAANGSKGVVATSGISNSSLRDSSIVSGGISTTPVAIHSGTFWKQGKYLSCSWKERHFQLFSTGELKWYLPGNSATVKGILANVNSSSTVINLPEKKVNVTRADKSKLSLHMLALKTRGAGSQLSPKTMLLGMESEQEMMTFIEKTKQISISASN
ncbi:hypothetical protein MDAP_001307 [Mitosporidium daphniae]